MGFSRHTERRQFGRKPTRDLYGWVDIPGRGYHRCTIRDLSPGGALLEFSDDVSLPYSFTLFIASLEMRQPCEIRHERGRLVGVEFCVEDQLRPDPTKLSLDEISDWSGSSKRTLASRIALATKSRRSI